MPLPDWSWDWGNRFYSIGGFWMCYEVKKKKKKESVISSGIFPPPDPPQHILPKMLITSRTLNSPMDTTQHTPTPTPPPNQSWLNPNWIDLISKPTAYQEASLGWNQLLSFLAPSFSKGLANPRKLRPYQTLKLKTICHLRMGSRSFWGDGLIS